MNNQKIAILDYGLGNLYSVKQALQYLELERVIITKDVNEIEHADKLILPGVGAFGAGINGLRDAGLIEAIIKHVSLEKPLLGICLGMQFLATQSEEMGTQEGLNIIPGSVVPIQNLSDSSSKTLKVPIVGWMDLQSKSTNNHNNDILKGLANRSVYFVHSYQFIPNENNDILATYEYGNRTITAAVKKDNVIGVQFHPEKSGPAGIDILKSFAFDM